MAMEYPLVPWSDLYNNEAQSLDDESVETLAILNKCQQNLVNNYSINRDIA
jgi:hypothetical protein